MVVTGSTVAAHAATIRPSVMIRAIGLGVRRCDAPDNVVAAPWIDRTPASWAAVPATCEQPSLASGCRHRPGTARLRGLPAEGIAYAPRRADAHDRPGPDRAAARGARGQSRAPPRADRQVTRCRCRSGRLPRARADRLPAPGPRCRGRDAPRRSAPGGAGRGDRAACRRSCRSSRNRPITGCSSRPPCSRTARSGTSTASSSCRPTGCSTSGGSSRRATCCAPRRRGSGSELGIGICEDFWHLSVPQLLALDGAQILINVSSSPGRDLAATNEVGLGTATSWRSLMRTYAQLTTSFVIFCNRVGVDESISFWGGSEVIAPIGRAVFSAPLYEEGLHVVQIATADIRRERIALPLLRDERPEVQVRELERIVAERAGLAEEPMRRAIEPGGPDHERPGARWTVRRSSCPRSWRSTRTLPAGSSAASSAASSTRPVSSEPCWGCRAGSIRRSSPTSLPRRSARTGCCACSCRTAPRRRRRGRTPKPWSPTLAAPPRSSRSRRWSTASSGRTMATVPPDRRVTRRVHCAAATSRPGCGWPCCTTGPSRGAGWWSGPATRPKSLIGYTTIFGDAACAFNPIGDLYKSQVRQLAVRPRRSGRHRSQGAVGRPVARPDRRDRGRVQLPGPRPDPVLADRQAPLDRGDGGTRVRRRTWSSGSTGWSRAPSSSARCRRSPSSARARPGSTTSTRAGARGRPERDRTSGGDRSGGGDRPGRWARRDPVRRGDTDREPRRHHAAGPRDPADGSAHRRRGHAAHPAACSAITGSRPGRRATTHRAARPARRPCSTTCRTGADLALVTDAGTPAVSDPGSSLVGAWAGEGGRVVPIPGASAVLAAVVASGVAGPRWSFEGFLPRTGRDRRERLRRHRR